MPAKATDLMDRVAPFAGKPAPAKSTSSSRIAPQLRRNRHIIIKRLRPLALTRPEPTDLIDISQHLRHRQIQPTRNLLIQLGGIVDRRARAGDSSNSTLLLTAISRIFRATKSLPLAISIGASPHPSHTRRLRDKHPRHLPRQHRRNAARSRLLQGGFCTWPNYQFC